MGIISRYGLVIAASAFAFVPSGYAFPGDLDPTFAGSGVASIVIDSQPVQYTPSQVVMLPDESLLAVGQSAAKSFALVRVLANGSPDLTFGNAGIVRTTIGTYSYAADAALQHDGRLVVVGGAQLAGSTPLKFTVARYLTDGRIDTSFRGGVFVEDTEPVASARAVAIDDTGRVLVGGSGSGTIVLVRYGADGLLDNTFGVGGRVAYSTSDDLHLSDLAYQTDGKIVGAGTCHDSACIMRWNPDGSIDTGFASGGTVKTSPARSWFRSIAVRRDGSIVAAGGGLVANQSYARLVLVSASGAQLSGDYFAYSEQEDAVANSIVVGHDDSVIAAGESGATPIFWKYRPDFVRETDFGLDGVARLHLYGRIEHAVATSGEKIVGISAAYNGGLAYDGFTFVRILLDFSGVCPESARTDCRIADRSLFLATQHPFDRAKGHAVWKAEFSMPGEDFGTPDTGTNYSICVYGGTAATLVPNAQLVVRADPSHWESRSSKWTFKNRSAESDGVFSMSLAFGPKNSVVRVKARGERRPPLGLPLPADSSPLRVQLTNVDSGSCWRTPELGLEINTARRLRAR